MAIELTLQNGRWSGRALKQFLEAWAPKSPLPLLTWMPWQATPRGMRTWIFAEGSTRGVFLTRRMSLLKGAPVTVRLNAMASPADWTVGYALLRALLQGRGGRVEGPDGRILRPEHLTDAEAVGDCLVQMRKDAGEVSDTLQRGERYAVFPNPEFSLVVTEAMLPRETDPARSALAFEDLLREMAARYQRAGFEPPATLPDGRSLAIWSMGEALLPWADHIGVRQGEEAQDGVVLPAAQAMTLLGDRLEVVSEAQDLYYIPAIDPGDPADRALMASLTKAGTPIADFLARFERQGQGMF